MTASEQLVGSHQEKREDRKCRRSVVKVYAKVQKREKIREDSKYGETKLLDNERAETRVLNKTYFKA